MMVSVGGDQELLRLLLQLPLQLLPLPWRRRLPALGLMSLSELHEPRSHWWVVFLWRADT